MKSWVLANLKKQLFQYSLRDVNDAFPIIFNFF